MNHGTEPSLPESYVRVRRPDGRVCMIDLGALEQALEAGDLESAYLLPESGKIVFEFEDAADETLSEDQEDEALPLDPISSRQKFRWMEEFMETGIPASLHVALKLALRQDKPFRRFKEALIDYPEARDHWYAFNAGKVRGEALSLLESFDWEILEVVDPRPPKPAPLEIEPEERVPLTSEEKDWILRGGWQVASRGGRTQLALLLKGSKNKSLLKHGLETSPVYGKLSFLTLEEIENRIDRMIQSGDLRVEFFGDLPLILLTDQGWERVRSWAYDQEWQQAAMADSRILLEMLRGWTNRRRDMQIELIEAETSLAPDSRRRVLQQWHDIAGQEVRRRIQKKLSEL